MQRLTAITHARFSLFRFRSPLLTESRLLSLPVGTEMFHFPTFPPPTLCVQVRVTGLASSRVSPFGNPRITVWLSTPRGLSQIPTSFFGSWCQGIHRVPLKTWHNKDARVHCVVLNIQAGPPDPDSSAPTEQAHGRMQSVGTRSPGRRKPARRLGACRPTLQDPTTCQAPPPHPAHFPRPTLQREPGLYLRAAPGAGAN